MMTTMILMMDPSHENDCVLILMVMLNFHAIPSSWLINIIITILSNVHPHFLGSAKPFIVEEPLTHDFGLVIGKITINACFARIEIVMGRISFCSCSHDWLDKWWRRYIRSQVHQWPRKPAFFRLVEGVVSICLRCRRRLGRFEYVGIRDLFLECLIEVSFMLSWGNELWATIDGRMHGDQF